MASRTAGATTMANSHMRFPLTSGGGESRRSVLYCIDQNLGAMIGARGNRQVEAIESLEQFAPVSSGAASQLGGNLYQQAIVVGVLLLEHAYVAFAAGHVDAPACGIVIEVVGFLRTRQSGDRKSVV